MSPTYQLATNTPDADGLAKPMTMAGIKRPAATFSEFELSAVLKAAAPGPAGPDTRRTPHWEGW